MCSWLGVQLRLLLVGCQFLCNGPMHCWETAPLRTNFSAWFLDFCRSYAQVTAP